LHGIEKRGQFSVHHLRIQNVSEEANHSFGDINITWFHNKLQIQLGVVPPPNHGSIGKEDYFILSK
jgi:hypothetical protein